MSDKSGFSEHNVIATYPDMETARKAVGALEDRGIDAARLSLLGQKAAEAIDQGETAAADERIMDEHAGTAVGGILAGGAAGGAAGFLAGLAAFGIPGAGPVVAAGIWGLTLGGTAAGAGVGLAATGYARIKQSEAWQLTYEAVSDGEVAVGVHSPDEDEVKIALEVLGEHSPTNVRHFDGEGYLLPVE